MRGTDRVVVAASFPSIPARAAVLKGRVGPVGGYSLQSVGEGDDRFVSNVEERASVYGVG
jgi:hypothetical protein